MSESTDRSGSGGVTRSQFMKWAGLGMGGTILRGTGQQNAPSQMQLPTALFNVPQGVHTRMTSPENPSGAKGVGARKNKGAKGRAFVTIPAGNSVDLLNADQAGIVNRIKLSTDDRSPQMLRSLRIDMYWDGAAKPAVSAPLGDFFGVGLGQTASFESNFFSNPEGRSFNCFIPMPFTEAARITITNNADHELHHLFYNVRYQLLDAPLEDAHYFHGFWNRNEKTTLGKDYHILPRVEGQGRFLGTNMGVQANPAYGNLWFGEGEVKMYLDGDRNYPSLVGTGTEDYIGTAWGQGAFDGPYQGSTIANKEDQQWAFYRYHIPDPVYFHEDFMVTIQQIGGGPIKQVRKLAKNGAPMKLVSVDEDGTFIPLREKNSVPDLTDPDFPEGWVNFFRRDDWSSTAYFYLNQPESNLPALPPVQLRAKNLRTDNK